MRKFLFAFFLICFSFNLFGQNPLKENAWHLIEVKKDDDIQINPHTYETYSPLVVFNKTLYITFCYNGFIKYSYNVNEDNQSVSFTDHDFYSEECTAQTAHPMFLLANDITSEENITFSLEIINLDENEKNLLIKHPNGDYLKFTNKYIKQSPEFLQNQEWFLHKLTVDNGTFIPVSNSEVHNISAEFKQYELFTTVCNYYSAQYDFFHDSKFYIYGGAISLIDCQLNENSIIEREYFNFFLFNLKEGFDYEYSENENSKQLIIRNHLGNEAIYGNSPLSINNLTKDKLFIYPNPAKDFIIIDSESNENLTIKISDINGRMILEKQLKNSKTKFSIESLAKGIYFVMIENQGNILKIEKIIKQ